MTETKKQRELTIDGSLGEGGGQIVRSSLALSVLTGRPIRIDNIRAGRKKPGLLRQHLTAVRAAATISNAKVDGDAIGSSAVTFAPGQVRGGEYTFSIGTAGSTTLVLQTILLPLLMASEPSQLTLEGGTHNPMAPPFEFLDKAYVPLLRRMGADVTLQLERPGFYPAGGGRIHAFIQPCSGLQPVELLERGPITRRKATVKLASLPWHIAKRELETVAKKCGWEEDELSVETVKNSLGPGNIVLLETHSENISEVFTGFGEINVSAERVATDAVEAYRRYLQADVPVGEYLADQLMLPMAIGGGGVFKTMGLSDHSRTHLQIIEAFLDRAAKVREDGNATVVDLT